MIVAVVAVVVFVGVIVRILIVVFVVLVVVLIVVGCGLDVKKRSGLCSVPSDIRTGGQAYTDAFCGNRPTTEPG